SSWAAAANKLCAQANTFVRSLPKPTTRARLVADIRAIDRYAERWLPRFAAIPQPLSERAAIQDLIATFRKESRVDNQLLPAFLRGDQATAQALSAQADRLDSHFNAAARRLGAHTCALNPEPSG